MLLLLLFLRRRMQGKIIQTRQALHSLIENKMRESYHRTAEVQVRHLSESNYKEDKSNHRKPDARAPLSSGQPDPRSWRLQHRMFSRLD